MLHFYHILIIIQIYRGISSDLVQQICSFKKRALQCISNNHSMYNNFYTIYNSLKFDDIIKK